MTDKEKTIKELKEALDGLDITNKYRLNIIRAIEYLQEEPVSEDLEEASVEWFNSVKYKSDLSGTPISAFKAGAQWQMSQMIKDATEVTVHIDAGNYPYIPQLELYDYDNDVPLAKEGDKYKVVLIKED